MNVKASSNQPMLALLTTRLEKLQKDLSSKSGDKINTKGFEQALKGAVDKAQGTENNLKKSTVVKNQYHTSTRLKSEQSRKSSVVDHVKQNQESANEQVPQDDQEYWMGQVMGLLEMLKGLAGDKPLGLATEDATAGTAAIDGASVMSSEEIAAMLQNLLETQLQTLGIADSGQLSRQLLTLAGVFPDQVGQSADSVSLGLEGLDSKTAQQLIAQLNAVLQNEQSPVENTDLLQAQNSPVQTVIQSLQKLMEKYSQTQGGTTSEANLEGKDQAIQQSPRFQELLSQLKPLLEQLAKGTITSETAAQQILAKPGLLDLIAQQVRMVQVMENQASTTPSVQATISQGDVEAGVDKVPAPEVAITQENEDIQKVEKSQEPKTSAIRGQDDQGQKPERLTANPSSTNGLTLQIDTNPMLIGSSNIPANPASLAEKPQQATVYRQLATSLVLNQLVESSQVLVGRDHSQIKVQLKPDFLGKVALEVSVENGVVKAEIAAESQQVKQLIEANLGSLKQHLADQGLKVEQLIVSLGQGQTQSGNAREQSPQGSKGNRKNQQDTVAFEIGDITAEYGGHLTEEQVVDYKI